MAAVRGTSIDSPIQSATMSVWVVVVAGLLAWAVAGFIAGHYTYETTGVLKRAVTCGVIVGGIFGTGVAYGVAAWLHARIIAGTAEAAHKYALSVAFVSVGAIASALAYHFLGCIRC